MRWFLLTPLLVLANCASPGTGAALGNSPGQVAHKLYIAKCAKCHKLYDPAKYSDADWDMWMTKMSKKSKLKPEQRKLLTDYIDETFRKAPVPR